MYVHGNVPSDLAHELLDTALDLPITFYDDPHLSRRAFRYATQFGMRAAYDAHYLALSEHLGCEMWTTDKRFYNSVHRSCAWVRLADEHEPRPRTVNPPGDTGAPKPP